MSVTLKKIADYCDVSIGTVSRALNNDPLIAEQTRERIRELAQKLDYIPSNLGRGLQSGKSRLIGCLIADINDSFNYDILQGISTQAAAEGYGVLIGITRNTPDGDLKQLDFFRQKGVDGIIITNYHEKSVSRLNQLHTNHLPMVVCDFASFNPEVPAVIIDDYKAMHLIVEHLAAQKHSRIAFAYHNNPHSLVRYKYCTEAALKLNIPTPVLTKNADELENILISDNKPTAVIAYSDFIAIEVIHLTKLLGLRIPQDIVITGFDDLYFAQWPEFSLTTICQPKTELGAIAAKKLIDFINGNFNPVTTFITPELKIRNSTN